jgi:heme-degrading monooxygenase HmoA
MFSSTFIFESKEYDAEFHERNDDIAARARLIDGFLGEEEWHNAETGLHGEVYYWSTREALTELVGMGVHREAKKLHDRWIGRYKVVIAEVLTIYGDPDLALSHQPALPEDAPRA